MKKYDKEKNIQLLEEQLEKTKNEKEKLYKEIEKLNLDNKANIKSFDEQIEKLVKENEKIKNENEKLKKEIEILKVAIDKDFDTLNKLKEFGIAEELKPSKTIQVDKYTNQIKGNLFQNFNEDNDGFSLLNNNFLNFYDVIIDIKSVKDINHGWEIKMNEKGEKNYNLYKEKEIIKIGVIGNANKGKSYILSKISKIELPSGTSIRTEGLSIKYPELELFKDRKIALLDSAGLETPVLKEDAELMDKELFKEKSREKLITELFLQNYIIHNSDILMLVVGILTYSEQKLLNRIKTEIQRAKLNKPLYIVHNLKTFVEVKQVEDYINNYLLKSATFDLVEGHKASTKIEGKTGTYFYEKNSNPKIFHLIFANEQSDSGSYYNNYTLEFLENSYQNVTDLKPFDVIKTVKERFVEISTEIIEKNETTQSIKIEDFEENKEDNKTIKLKNEQNFKLKQCLIDELGFSNLKNSGFEPHYNYYKKGDDSVIIRVELPGNCDLSSKVEYGDYTIIRLSGTKKKDKEPNQLEDNIHNTREFGSFSLDIPLKTEEFLIKNEEPTCSNKKGLMILEYKLDKKKDSINIQIKEEEEV